MHDPLFLHVLECASDLIDVHPYLVLGNEIRSIASAPDILLQVPFLRPLNCDEHFIVLDEAFNVLCNVLMLQSLHQLHFLDTVVSLLDIIHVKDLQELESNELFSLDVLRLEHKGELALADRLYYDVVPVLSTVEVSIANGAQFGLLLILFFLH